jgi:hypothetical protein
MTRIWIYPIFSQITILRDISHREEKPMRRCATNPSVLAPRCPEPKTASTDVKVPKTKIRGFAMLLRASSMIRLTGMSSRGRAVLACLLIAVIGIAGHPARVSATTFFDGTFNPADWEVILFTGGNGGTTTTTQVTSGGNPGEYRRIENTINNAPGPGLRSRVWGFHRRIGATYNPQVQGTIDSIDYSEDSILISGAGQGMGTGPAMRQNGGVYVIVPFLITPEDSWTHKQLTGLSEANFVLMTGGEPPVDPTQHPDFSASGGPIEFGFVRANSTGPGGGGFERTGGIDNWSLSINRHPFTIVIDIKPGSDPNSINCNKMGVITVAILSTQTGKGELQDFDATTVDHTTVTFEGASETHVNKKTGKARRHEEDVDKDGDIDLVLHFRNGETHLDCNSTEGTLTGETFDGQAITGSDSINSVPAAPALNPRSKLTTTWGTIKTQR